MVRNMKGQHYVFGLLIVLVLVIVFLLVSLPFLPKSKADFKEQGEPKLAEIIKYYENYQFNPEDLFVDPTTASTVAEYFQTPVDGITPYCSDFKNAFIESIKSEGEPIIVKEIDLKEGTSQDISSNLLCNGLKIIEIKNSVPRSICTVSDIYLSTIEATENDITRPFYNYEPYIHGCYVPNDFISLINEDGTVHKVQYYNYLPPYYIPTIDTNNGFKDTGYSMRIVISNASLGVGTDCAYHMFVCVQPAISKNENGVAYKIFEHFKEVITDDMKCCKGVTNKINSIYIHPYTFDFTDETDKPTINQVFVAIEAGLWEWSKTNFENTNLIKRILDENVPEGWKPGDIKPKYIKFNYAPLTKGITWPALTYPDCTDWYTKTPEEITTMSNFYYAGSTTWGIDEKNTNYDKLVMTYTFEYTIENVDDNGDGYDVNDAVDYRILVITPHITLCRNII